MLTQQLIEGFAHSRWDCDRNLHYGHLLVDDQKNNGNGQLVIASWAASRGFRDVGKRSPLRSCTVPYYIAPEGLIIPPVQQIDPDSIDLNRHDDIGTFDGTDNGDESTVEEEEEEEESKKEEKETSASETVHKRRGCVTVGYAFAEFILGSSLLQQIRVLRRCRTVGSNFVYF